MEEECSALFLVFFDRVKKHQKQSTAFLQRIRPRVYKMKKATNLNKNKANLLFFRHLNKKQIKNLQTPLYKHKGSIVDPAVEKRGKAIGWDGGSILPSKTESSLLKKKKRLHNQLLQFLKSSSHFGRKSRHLDFAFPWHASMCNQFSGIRNKVAHINARQTFQSLVEAFYCIALVLRKGGKVLVINKNSEFSSLFYPHNLDGTVLQAKHTPCFTNNSSFFENGLRKDLSPSLLFERSLEQISGLQSQERGFEDLTLARERPATAPLKWVGGCLTNWKEISKSIATLLYFSKRFGAFINQNNIHFPRFKKMKNSFQGFINIEKEQLLLKERPQLLFLFNTYESQQILQEAIGLQIPVVALTDSSTDLSQITHPIPINSDSAHLVYWCLSQLIQMIERQERFSKSP